jgi:cytochrome c oxidase subunit 4
LSDHPEQIEPGQATEHAHPSARRYIQIAVILGVITALEVGLYYIPHEYGFYQFLSPSLIALSAIKFGIVGAFYMHLKFDSKLFTYFFVGGLALAASLVLAFMTLFGTWWQAPIAPPTVLH